MSGCDRCGCYMRGLQDAYWVTYLVNLAVTAAREEIERERSNHPRYGETPRPMSSSEDDPDPIVTKTITVNEVMDADGTRWIVVEA